MEEGRPPILVERVAIKAARRRRGQCIHSFSSLTCTAVLPDELQLHPYVLPIMQGFFQVSTFHVAREPVASEEGNYVTVEYHVISRRSRDRAGLRYQRRGIDDDANVANFVETETVMRVEVCFDGPVQRAVCLLLFDMYQREAMSNVFSHVQVRGSSRSFQDSLTFSSTYVVFESLSFGTSRAWL